METALAPSPDRLQALRTEFGPLSRSLASRYFESVRFPAEAEAELRKLHSEGFVVHVMRTTAWINYCYLDWALVMHGLPPVRAVVNLRPWFARPWSNTAQRGDFDVRFTYARMHQGSGLLFLKQSAFGRAEGKYHKDDPFPALVALARKSETPVFLVPELFVWEKRSARLRPSLLDRIFGSPDAPGFLHSVMAFWRNHQRAQFRVGEAIDLRKFIEESPTDSDAVIARKVRSALHHHLARETRSVFGPPYKPTDRLIEETLRDRGFRDTLDQFAKQSRRPLDSVVREAKKNLQAIASKFNPTLFAFVTPILSWIFHRIYDGIEVDEAGLDRALKSAGRAPIVLCPSHKSHIDYMILSWVLWMRGYTAPLVAAGANLSFFPLGSLFRRGGAFFLRRSFKGDVVYTASFKAYVKKLVFDGIHQEFFPEGGRSRTGKLLPPKLGMLTWEVDAVLDGASNDLHFIPVSIDYEKVVETGSYSKELAGGEKKPEDIKALLSAPKVLTANYGRIHLSFDEPISLVDFMKSRGLSLQQPLQDEDKKSLVRALGNRIMYGITRVSTVTPHALASAALLAHRRRGITSQELRDRVQLLRQIAEDESAPLSSTMREAPCDPTVAGPIHDALKTFVEDHMVRAQDAKGDTIYQVEDDRRAELAFYKNTLLNLLAPRSLVANALLASRGPSTVADVKDRALFLSRLFKVEFIYRVGASFDVIFAETLEKLIRMKLISRDGEMLSPGPEAHVRPVLLFIADLLRDYLESYLLAVLTLKDVAEKGGIDKKTFIRYALDTGRAEFLSGRIGTSEALSRTTLENAVAYLIDQQILVEKDKKLILSEAFTTAKAREGLVDELLLFLHKPRPD